jgi:hypothetical protein
VCDSADDCPADANADQADQDGDGAGDACDPDDPDAGPIDPPDVPVDGGCSCGCKDTRGIVGTVAGGRPVANVGALVLLAAILRRRRPG